MRVLEGLQPEKVFYFFEELAGIPHGSGNVQAISDYCVRFAKERDLWVRQDEMGNVIIRKQAAPGYEKEPAVVLQGHLDMVCEKTEDCQIDFEQDGLKLETDGTMIWAKGTTLGGDDGIAAAYGMAIMDAEDIPHPELELVLTVDEEIGLLGAVGIDLSDLVGRRLINLDSEEEGIFLTSCAGGLTLRCDIPLECEKRDGILCEIRLDGCQGGHSGTEINKGRLNANEGLGRALFALQKKADWRIVSLEGGSKDNAIPRAAQGRLLVQDVNVAEKLLKEAEDEIGREYAGKEEGITISLKQLQTAEGIVCLTSQATEKAVHALINMPSGVQAMSGDVEGMVETSLNMGVMRLDCAEEGAQMQLKYAVRSSRESAKRFLTDRAVAMVEQMGGSCEISGEYPGWEYKRESGLRDLFIEKYRKLYGKEPVCEGIHAGVECGLFVGKLPDMDCISLGPNIHDVHTPNEKLDVASVERTWRLLLEALSSKQKD